MRKMQLGQPKRINHLVRSQYLDQFTAYASQMPAVASKLGYIADGQIAQGYADMTLVRDSATTQSRSAYPLRMTLGSDGVWRISEM